MATASAAGGDAPATTVYRRRRPERTALYQVVQENLETWLVERRRQDEHGNGVAGYIERDLRRYLDCGLLCRGFARVHCARCGHDSLVAFSCKGRGVCVSCTSRHMAQTAAHLVDHVFPQVPVRQWVLSVPKRLRYFLHDDADLARRVQRILLRAIESHLKASCAQAPGDAQFAAVSFIQRFGRAGSRRARFAEGKKGSSAGRRPFT